MNTLIVIGVVIILILASVVYLMQDEEDTDVTVNVPDLYIGDEGRYTAKGSILIEDADDDPIAGEITSGDIDLKGSSMNVKVKEITSDGIALADEKGEKSVLAYDTLVISRGRKRDNALARQLQARATEVHEIGDCASVGDIQKAIFSANEVARAI